MDEGGLKMGLLIDGKWKNDWYDTKTTGGEFIRQDSQFRKTITANGHGDTLLAEVDRYHLFVSYACPWAHRAIIFRQIKQLNDVIGLTVVNPKMLKKGWEIQERCPVKNAKYLHQVYTATDKNYSGRVTVPVLWDKKHKTIVNNESAEIIRIFNSEFNEFTDYKDDYYPEELREDIDSVNGYIYENINNGVYKVGFATTQTAYELAFNDLFKALEVIDGRLNRQRYLVGEKITEADWRLFTTLIRFDCVYHSHFKTNLKRIEDYPNLSNYLRDLYQQPGIAETVKFDHIKTHYYYSHDMINPTRIIPLGPQIDYNSFHDRERF